MIFDGLVVILLVLAFLRGWSKGLLWAICSFIAVFISIFFAMKLSQSLADFLFVQNILTGKYTLLLAFIILFLAGLLIFRIGIRFVETVLDKLLLGWLNKLMGALLYVFFVGFVMSLFCWMANEVQLIKVETKSTSKVYPFIEPIAPKTVQLITPILPIAKEILQKTKSHLNKVSL
jgi:membrane protein required for colicin V production